MISATVALSEAKGLEGQVNLIVGLLSGAVAYGLHRRAGVGLAAFKCSSIAECFGRLLGYSQRDDSTTLRRCFYNQCCPFGVDPPSL